MTHSFSKCKAKNFRRGFASLWHNYFLKKHFAGDSRVNDTFIFRGAKQKIFHGNFAGLWHNHFFKEIFRGGGVTGLWHIHFSKYNVKKCCGCFAGLWHNNFFKETFRGFAGPWNINFSKCIVKNILRGVRGSTIIEKYLCNISLGFHEGFAPPCPKLQLSRTLTNTTVYYRLWILSKNIGIPLYVKKFYRVKLKKGLRISMRLDIYNFRLSS